MGKKGEYIELNKELRNKHYSKKQYRDLLRILLVGGNAIVIFYFVFANLLKGSDIYFVNEMYSFIRILASGVIVLDIIKFIHVNHINRENFKKQVLKSGFIAALGLGTLYVNSIDFNEHLISGAQITYNDKQIFMNEGKTEYYENINPILMKKIPTIESNENLDDTSNLKFGAELEKFTLSESIDFNKHARLLPYMGRGILNKKFGESESLGDNTYAYNDGTIIAKFSDDGKTLIRLSIKSTIAEYEGIKILDRSIWRFPSMVQVAGVAMTPAKSEYDSSYMLVNEETHVDIRVIVEPGYGEEGYDDEIITEIIYENSDYV